MDWRMRVAVLCEFSGAVRDAFRRRGHDAVSCDLLPTETPGPHIQGDCREYDWSEYDLVIAHPPCTYLCNSGVRWLHERPERMDNVREAAEFFTWCLNVPAKMVCVENPIMHRYATEMIGRRYSQIVQPWMFGAPESKATCLWLRGLPPLRPTMIVSERRQRVWMEPQSKDRWKKRSITPHGIAEAMAEQWGRSSVLSGVSVCCPRFEQLRLFGDGRNGVRVVLPCGEAKRAPGVLD